MTVGFLQWHLHFSETIYLGGIFNLPVKLHLEKKSHLNSAISLFFFIPSHYSESLLSCQIREKKKERKIVRSLSISFDLIAQTHSFAKLGFQTLLIILVFSYFTLFVLTAISHYLIKIQKMSPIFQKLSSPVFFFLSRKITFKCFKIFKLNFSHERRVNKN